MAVVRSILGLTKVVLTSSKILFPSTNTISCCRTLSSCTNISILPFSRMKTPLLKQNSRATGTARLEHVSGVHTRGDKILIEVITEEIEAELKLREHPDPPKIKGFDIQTDSAEVKMTKKYNSENITVTANVNHTLNDDDDGNTEKEEQNMISKPNFNIEIQKGSKTLAFSCSFATDVQFEDSDSAEECAFQITELSMYDKEWEDETYSVSGDLLDGTLYDLLMNMLEERGIGNSFAREFVEYCTSYEHNLYIGFLKDLKEFVSNE